jgi:hypothetical protein
MRSLGISTGGTYTFLTNHSGIGGGHLIQELCRPATFQEYRTD